jgi:hypothetical protein
MSGGADMTSQSEFAARPELSVEERILRDLVKRIRKLRWINAQRPKDDLGRAPEALVGDEIERLNQLVADAAQFHGMAPKAK